MLRTCQSETWLRDTPIEKSRRHINASLGSQLNHPNGQEKANVINSQSWPRTVTLRFESIPRGESSGQDHPSGLIPSRLLSFFSLVAHYPLWPTNWKKKKKIDRVIQLIRAIWGIFAYREIEISSKNAPVIISRGKVERSKSIFVGH